MTVLTRELAKKLVDEQGLDVVIPDIYTSIGGFAFWGKNLKSVYIPDSVTYIADGAFSGNKLSDIDIPDSVTSIGDAAFQKNKLTSIDIPDGVTSIGEAAFQENKLTSIDIPDGVTSIGDWAFYGNDLSSVVIPDGVTTIGDWAFFDNDLSSIVIPDSVTSIGINAFASIPHSVPDDIDNRLDLYPFNDMLSIWGDGVHSSGYISVYAFDGQFTNNIEFFITGKNKFSGVIQDQRKEGDKTKPPSLNIELTNTSNGDAFFLHDTYNDYPDSVVGTTDVFGRDYIARAQNLQSLKAGDGDDLVDLTSTETREIYGGVKRSGGGVANVYGGNGDDVILGGDGNVFGENGDDTLISHHSASMTGGNGEDIFGFIATPKMQDEVTGLNRDPIHTITDFVSGEDSMQFYVSTKLTDTGSMETGNNNHITKTEDGDIE